MNSRPRLGDKWGTYGAVVPHLPRIDGAQDPRAHLETPM